MWDRDAFPNRGAARRIATNAPVEKSLPLRPNPRAMPESRSTITVETGDSVRRLQELTDAVDKAQEAYKEAAKSNDHAKTVAAQKVWKEATRELAKHTQALERTELAAKELSSMTLVQLERRQRDLIYQLKRTHEGTQEYQQLQGQLQQVNTRVGELRQSLRATTDAQRDLNAQTQKGALGHRLLHGLMGSVTGAASKMGGALKTALNSLSGGFLGAIGSIAGVIGALKKAVGASDEFTAKMANLQALTGLRGDDLDWLGEKARSMGSAMTDAGVRIAKSSNEIADAFALMGSAKPELLGDKEALAGVTEAALTLAAAAGLDTNEAVTSLANTMNQFGAGAQEASRYINTLAAGSQAGSAGVDLISKAITKFGAVAAGANLSVEESVALIETLAAKGIQGEVAGTKLNSVLIALQTGADAFNPKIVGLNQAFENLAAANLTTAEKVKIFGQGNIAAGEILIQNRAQLADLTQAVTGTGTAFEQAAINTNDNATRTQQMLNRLQVAYQKVGDALQPLLANALSFLTSIMDTLGDLWDDTAPLREFLGNALGAIFEVVKAQIQMVVDVLATLLKGLSSLVEWIGGATTATEKYNQAIAREQAALDQLVATATDEGATLQARQAAIEEINARYGQYLPNLLSEKSTLQEIAQAQELATQALEHNMAVKMRQEALEKAAQKGMEGRQKLLTKLYERVAEDAGANSRVAKAELDGLLRQTEISLEQAQAFAAKWGKLHFWDSKQTTKDGQAYSRTLADMIRSVKTFEKENHDSIEKVKQEYDSLLNTTTAPQTYQHAAAQPKAAPAPAAATAAASAAQPAPARSKAPAPIQGTADATKAELQKAADITEQWYKAEQIKLIEAYTQQKLTKGQLAEEQHVLELTYLIKRRAEAERAGKNLVDLDLQIARATQAVWDDAHAQELEAQKKANEEKLKEEQEQAAKEQEVRDAQIQAAEEEAERRKEITKAVGEFAKEMTLEFTDLMGEYMTQTEDQQGDFGKRLSLIMLNTLHKIVRMVIGQVWIWSMGMADSIASYGIIGALRAAAITVAIEGVFAGIKAAVTSQNYQGRLLATGAQDGRTYTVPYLGEVEGVTYVPNPALISERGGELIVDAARSRQIRLRYPWLLEQLRAVPQHASGTLGVSATVPSAAAARATTDPTRSAAPTATERELANLLREANRTLGALRRDLGGGVQATVQLHDIESAQQRAQAARQRAGR